jgi:glutathione synthase
MQKCIGLVLDPLGELHPRKDSSIVLMTEAQRRGHSIYCFEQQGLFVKDGEVFAPMLKINIRHSSKKWFHVEETLIQNLDKCDIILMRKDPPVDMQYIYTTQLLEIAERKGVKVINKPQALRDVNEKLFISWFPECCVPALVTSSPAQLKEFLQKHNDVIIKPLNGMGGLHVFRVRNDDPNVNVIIEVVTENYKTRAMAQRYIPEVQRVGDKRIIMFHGEPLPYAITRMAKKGETRANLAAGGQYVKAEFTEHDRWICKQVGPTLKEKGLFFVGLDVIGDYLTEINVTSPTCLKQIDEVHGINSAAIFWDGM